MYSASTHASYKIILLAIGLCLGMSGCGGSSGEKNTDPSSAATTPHQPTATSTNTSNSQPANTPPVNTPPVAIDPPEPVFNANLFNKSSTDVTNEFYPLVPGATNIYEGFNEDGEFERIEINVSHLTKMIDGVDSTIVVERNYVDDELVEETFDWFAQDAQGNVWYMGEDSADYEDGELTSKEGSWESGKDVDGSGSNAVAGIIMKKNLKVGDSYRQEFYESVAEDQAVIRSVDSAQTLADGSVHTAVQIEESNPLEEDSINEYKYFASGIGFIAEEDIEGNERIELVEQKNQKLPDITAEDFSNPRKIDNEFFPLAPGTVREYEVYEDEALIETITIEVLRRGQEGGDKIVHGVPVVVQRDRVSDADGLIIEDTYDWFAQDDEGNVWYLGEHVVNYNYDGEGNLLSTDNGGSFEWGIDGAQPGIQMLADPRVGDSYRQEYYQGEAEDIAAVLEADVAINVSGTDYATLKTEDWNPLEEEDVREHKYYAPGVGVVREEKTDGSEFVILTSLKLPKS